MNKTAIKDAINRLVKNFSVDFQDNAKPVINRVIALLAEGVPVDLAVETVMNDSRFFQKNAATMKEYVFQAAAVGYGINPKIVLEPAKFNVIEKLVSLPWAPDKFSLSERLHGTELSGSKKIVEVIKSSIKEGANVTKMARALYDGYGYGHETSTADLPKYIEELLSAAKHHLKDTSAATMREYTMKLNEARANINNLAAKDAPTQSLKAAYKQLLKTVEQLNEKAINNSVYVAIMEKSRYNAERIARTEIARAWGEGFFADTYEDADVMAYKWSLSSRHSQFDICDFHANANLYGLGPGIYPKKSMPVYPAHPHCTCQLSEVITGSNKNKARDNVDKGGKKYLNSLTETQRDGLLTYKGNELFKQGKPWQDHLNNWQGHEDPNPRLTKGDFK